MCTMCKLAAKVQNRITSYRTSIHVNYTKIDIKQIASSNDRNRKFLMCLNILLQMLLVYFVFVFNCLIE